MQMIIRNMPDDLHKALKVLAAELSKPMNALIIEAVEAKLKSARKENKNA